jgi:hypothetical protein
MIVYKQHTPTLQIPSFSTDCISSFVPRCAYICVAHGEELPYIIEHYMNKKPPASIC